MSERKVLTKYYPPEFDPNALKRKRGPKQAGPKVQTVRLMAPFSMRCTQCGEYIYKGRKFNARKETPVDERYLGIQIHRFYIRCTRCSAEIIFKTDPKNQDYAVVQGAKRNTEPWRRGPDDAGAADETDEQRLDRLELEEADAAEQDRMQELEAKTVDARREMDIANALDEIRMRNARLERADKDGVEATVAPGPEDAERERQEREDEEAARLAFAEHRALLARQEEVIVEENDEEEENWRDQDDGPKPPETVVAAPPAAKRQKKAKKDYSAMLGIKKKPSLV